MKNPQLVIEPASRFLELPTELEDMIRRRAYEIYEERQGLDGTAQADWLRAEAEILSHDVERKAA